MRNIEREGKNEVDLEFCGRTLGDDGLLFAPGGPVGFAAQLALVSIRLKRHL